MSNLVFDRNRYRPFLLKRTGTYTRDCLGGPSPGGRLPAIVLPSTRFLLRLALSPEDDLLVFTSVMEEPLPAAVHPLSVLARETVSDESDPRLQFLVVGREAVEASLCGSIEGSGFEWGPEQLESDRATGNTDFANSGHKSGGIPYLAQKTEEMLRDIERLEEAGYAHILQLCFPSKKDELPARKYWTTTSGRNWLFLNRNLHIWCLRDANLLRFRYCFN